MKKKKSKKEKSEDESKPQSVLPKGKIEDESKSQKVLSEDKSSKDEVEQKEVCETFEVGKEGEEKIIKTCGVETLKPATKEQIQRENKILRNIFIGVGVIIFLFIIGWATVNSVRHFEYRDLNFNVVKEGNIIFYNTAFPVYSKTGRHTADYNFYIRNDPRKLDNIAFNGELVLLEDMVINMTEDFNCDGDGVISIANLLTLYNFAGTKVVKDENASCDSQGRYMFVNIQPGEETNIEQVGPACYNLNVNNCEILDVTERFMIETFVKIDAELKN